jgi:hypothetical protein
MTIHRIFIIILLLLGAIVVADLTVTGVDYYSTPNAERPFHSSHSELKPSGKIGHTLGVCGAAMISIAVAGYTTRKRMRMFRNAGKLSVWLEIHMFMCSLGALLVLYHSTFKAGGIAAISLWTMLCVVASGVVGRFLYVLIPRGSKGNELTSRQIDEEFDRQQKLFEHSPIGSAIAGRIDRAFSGIQRPRSFTQFISIFYQIHRTKKNVRRDIRRSPGTSALTRHQSRDLMRLVSSRASLIQRSLLLLQVEKAFYYWHAIHLPFTTIMFLTLAVHIAVALWLGYTWLF